METTPGTASTDEGIRLLKAGEIDQAIEVLGKALQADSDDARAHMVLGIAYNKKNDRLHAIHHLEESVRLDETARAYYNLGLVYESAKRVDEAIREYRMAVDLDPSYTPAQEALKKLHDQFEAEHPRPASEVPQAAVAGSPVAAAAGATAASPAGPVPARAGASAATASIPGMPGSHPVGGPAPGAYLARQIAEQKKVQDAHKELMRSGLIYGAICGAFLFVLISLVGAFLVSVFSGKIALLYLLIQAGIGAVFGGLVGLWIGYTAGDEMAGVQAGAVLAFVFGVVLALIGGAGFGVSMVAGLIYGFFGAVGGWVIGKLVDSSIGGV